MDNFTSMKAQNTAAWFIIIALSIVGLILGKSLLIPFVVAFLIWFIVKKFRNMIDKVEFIKNKIPRWIKTGLASVIVFALVTIICTVLVSSIETIIASYDSYEENMHNVAKNINNTFQMDLEKEISDFLHGLDIEKYLSSLFSSISGLLGNAMMILFYALFIFAEESSFARKIHLMFTDKTKQDKLEDILGKMDRMFSDYISLKSLVSVITAGLSLIILWIIGIDSPIFWAFLIFIMNFIPSIGSIIATIFPAFFCLIQFGGFTEALIVLGVIGTIQVVVGNVVEPRIMGNTLNISPLVTIISMSLWGVLWGILGMILSLPITVAMIIVMSQFPNTRSLAILLSEKGRV